MRIVSLLPAATEIVCALGLQKELLGISHECNFPALVRKKPRISHADVDYDSMSSKDIDSHVEKRMYEKKSLYRLDKTLLDSIKPTHILTQALCDVCAITPSDIQKVIYDLSPKPNVIELNPRSVDGICEDILSLGKQLNKKNQAYEIVNRLKKKIVNIKRKWHAQIPKTVFCLEWLDPLYACGHWIPEMVEIAGGMDPLSFPEKYSRKISWESVITQDPEILILMPCSFSIEKTRKELFHIAHLSFWENLKAVKTNHVWIVDGSSYFNQSGIRTIENGIEILAKIIHPEIFGKPTRKEALHVENNE